MKVRIEHDGRTPCAASALKFVLDNVIDDFSAIDVIGGNIETLFPTQIL